MSLDKTQNLQRKDLPINDLEPNLNNPNEMSEQQFNMLYDNIERMGITDPILVRPLKEKKGKYRIIGGHHRWEVAKIFGYEEVPCTIVNDPNFDDDMEKFQMVRHNIIHGSMSAKKFTDLYASLSTKYTEEAASEMFGFTSEEEFRKLVRKTGASLPKEMQAEFKKAVKEIKTVADLSLVLNSLFTAHGDTLPHGYMVFDFGGQEHLWIRMQAKQRQQMVNLGNYVRSQNRTLDAAIAVLLQLTAQGNLSQEGFEEAFLATPEVDLSDLDPDGFPAEDEIVKAKKLDAALS